MLRLRPYKSCDAETIVSWIGDEVSFRKWCADRSDSSPITADHMNRHYTAFSDADWFYPMTVFDETGVVGHLIMRFTDEEKTVLRFGFVIVDDKKRGMGLGTQMLLLAERYAFDFLKASRITLGVFENNEPACRCYRSAGFRKADTDQETLYHVMGQDWKTIELEILPDARNHEGDK